MMSHGCALIPDHLKESEENKQLVIDLLDKYLNETRDLGKNCRPVDEKVGVSVMFLQYIVRRSFSVF